MKLTYYLLYLILISIILYFSIIDIKEALELMPLLNESVQFNNLNHINDNCIINIEKYKEPIKEDSFINPYYDLNHNTSHYIQCNSDFNENKSNTMMCPEYMPLCKGYIENKQFGFCNEIIKKDIPISYQDNDIHCKFDFNNNISNKEMCPHNLPYCYIYDGENGICKNKNESYVRELTKGKFNKRFNKRLNQI